VKVLVTGAAGFVGRRLCDTLASRGFEVVPTVRGAAARDEIAVGEIGPETDWRAALATQPDVVVHLAARVHVMKDDEADPLKSYRAVNVEGSLNLSRQAVAAGVKRLVYLSSIKVNGESNSAGRPCKADDTPAPEDPYGISKHEAEQLLRQIATETGMEVVIIRSPLVYGPGVKGNFASLVHWGRKGIPLPLGAVHNKRSLVAVENLVDFIALCADPERSPRAANEVFLISDGEDVSTTELLRKVANAYNVAPRLLPIPVIWIQTVARLLGKRAVADRLLGSLVVDSSKACDLLGWKPVVSMDEQLKKMALHDTRI
jgi:nucleoside-diphosphate-sugar epimerase